jgi:hypothetical protein
MVGRFTTTSSPRRVGATDFGEEALAVPGMTRHGHHSALVQSVEVEMCGATLVGEPSVAGGAGVEARETPPVRQRDLGAVAVVLVTMKDRLHAGMPREHTLERGCTLEVARARAIGGAVTIPEGVVDE